MRFRLIPRDEGFYPMFDAAATNANSAAHLLASSIRMLPLTEDVMKALAAAEHTGDEINRSVRQRLETTLVTPFDREDIQALAGALDDVMDDIRAAAETAFLHNIDTPLAGFDVLVDLLKQATDTNVGLVRKLQSLKGLNDDIDIIDRLESEGDRQFRIVMAELFNGQHDALEILRWKDVVEAVERALNAVERSSDIMQSISVKHA